MWFRRKELSDKKLKAISSKLSNRLAHVLVRTNGPLTEPITITLQPDEFGYLTGYLESKVGIK